MKETAINPYAPPSSIEKLLGDHPGIWREGDILVVFNDAVLPKICLVTGEPGEYAHPIQQYWQPRWVYSLLLLFVLPYLLVSPFVYRRIELTVAFGKTVYTAHRQAVNRGLAMVLISSLILISLFIATIYGLTSSIVASPILIVCVVAFLAGVVMASRFPLKLDVLKVDGKHIYLQNVHPDFLRQVPDRLIELGARAREF